MTSQTRYPDVATRPPCSAHARWQQDCVDCQDQIERAGQITCKLADLGAAAETGLGAVAGAMQALAALAILYDEPLMGDAAGDLKAELDTAARALRHVRRIIALRTAAVPGRPAPRS